MTKKNRIALVAASLLAACGAVALYPPGVAQGQQAPAPSPGDLDLAGRSATVEYRPVASGLNQFIQKQRVGVIRKVTPEWVVLEETGGALVAVPREMVLEIRFDKK
jgi:hypothetical protein